MKTPPTIQLGFLAEEYAAEYLRSKGYQVLGHNYRKPWGEIDVIAEKEKVIVFVEVKANKKEILGFEPERRVNSAKRHRMDRIARTFLADYHFRPEQPWQLDVISVTLNKERGIVKIRHYKNID